MIELKKRRVVDGFQRSEWSKTHGRDAYGENDEHESDHAKVFKPRLSQGKPNPRVRACVVLVDLQLTAPRLSFQHYTKPVIVAVDSPSQSSDAVSDVHSISDIQSETGGIDSDDYMMYDLCTCGSSGRAHKRA